MKEDLKSMWNDTMKEELKSVAQNKVWNLVYLPEGSKRISGSKFIFLVLYIDDILLATNDVGLLHKTKEYLSNNFEMKDMGEASYVTGISIVRDRSQGLSGLSQKAYIDKILERFNMSKCSDGIVPIQKGDKFSLKQCPKNDVERKEIENIPYASVMGSLMYLQTCTRPGISFAIEMLSRYQSNPVVGYADSDYVGCVDSRKSTFGYVFQLAEGAISRKSAKQSIIAASTMEEEFVACYEATIHA
ncbi:retrovirus-related pol polyprotein from transposon TNT 1-94 [Tanacetum coccineum]